MAMVPLAAALAEGVEGDGEALKGRGPGDRYALFACHLGEEDIKLR